MKKYTNLTLDCSTLVTETLAHLNATQNIEDEGHHTQALHWMGSKNDLVTAIPSINTDLAQFDVRGFGHYAVNSTLAVNTVWGDNFLLVPLMECEQTVVKLFSINPGATPTYEGNYADEDCTLTDTIQLAGPIFIARNIPFTLERLDNDTNLSDVLVVFIDGDTDSYLAE